jgi:hypothetical protein
MPDLISEARARVLATAERRIGIPYRLDPPPDGVTTLDCSLYVVLTYRDAGLPFSPGVRTAEQIRQDCDPIAWNDVQAGDLLFFEHTYEPSGPPGPDGRIASHIGISLGAGSGRMWDCRESTDPNRPDGVGQTNIWTDYWQQRLFEARRPRGLTTTAVANTLPDDADHAFTFAELWPHIQAAAERYGADARVLAAMVAQESSFVNWRVHRDGHGHGLLGLDDRGLLPEFEAWSGLDVGRGTDAISIPPELQLDFAARWLATATERYGSALNAARVWHRGPGAWMDEQGDYYDGRIRARIAELFG